jgi:hypothetical protein
MCYLCKETDMRSAKELYCHLIQHGGVEEHGCQKCGKTYRYRRLLNRHVLAVHEEFQVSVQDLRLFTFAGQCCGEDPDPKLDLNSTESKHQKN